MRQVNRYRGVCESPLRPAVVPPTGVSPVNDLSIYTAVARKSRCLPRANINSLASAVMNPTQLRELVSNYRASNVLKELRDHGMVELCNFNDHSIPVSLAAMIEDQCKLSASLEMIRCQEMRQVFSVLDDARIESLLVLGGTALAYSIYKAPWRRPRSGTNILVEKKFPACHYCCAAGDRLSTGRTCHKLRPRNALQGDK